jgi:hypothetical protein
MTGPFGSYPTPNRHRFVTLHGPAISLVIPLSFGPRPAEFFSSPGHF